MARRAQISRVPLVCGSALQLILLAQLVALATPTPDVGAAGGGRKRPRLVRAEISATAKTVTTFGEGDKVLPEASILAHGAAPAARTVQRHTEANGMQEAETALLETADAAVAGNEEDADEAEHHEFEEEGASDSEQRPDFDDSGIREGKGRLARRIWKQLEAQQARQLQTAAPDTTEGPQGSEESQQFLRSPAGQHHPLYRPAALSSKSSSPNSAHTAALTTDGSIYKEETDKPEEETDEPEDDRRPSLAKEEGKPSAEQSALEIDSLPSEGVQGSDRSPAEEDDDAGMANKPSKQVWRKNVKTRLDDLERAGLASQKTFYNMMRRLERAEKRQESDTREQKKVFRSLESFVEQDLAATKAGGGEAKRADGKAGAAATSSRVSSRIKKEHKEEEMRQEEGGTRQHKKTRRDAARVSSLQDVPAKKTATRKHAAPPPPPPDKAAGSSFVEEDVVSSEKEETNTTEDEEQEKGNSSTQGVGAGKKKKKKTRTGTLLERLEAESPEGCLKTKSGARDPLPLYDVDEPGSVKCLAGVPIYNFHKAYNTGGGPSLAQLNEESKVWLVTFPSTYTDKDIRELCQNPTGSLECEWDGHPSEGGAPTIQLRGTLSDLEEELSDHPDTRYVEPDHEQNAEPEVQSGMMEDAMPSSARCSLQKLLDATSKNGVPPATWGLDRIDNEGPIDCRTQDMDESAHGKGAVIWILDTGVRISHQEFEGRAKPGIDLTIGKGVVDCKTDKTGKCGQDGNGHGTHCAGTAAGKTYGVANQATIMPAKVLNDDKSGKLSWILAALDYIVVDYTTRGEQEPCIVSMSLGGEGSSPTMQDNINRAIDVGIVVTVAAGNAAEDACDHVPAYIPSVITVAAINPQDQYASYSNYGSCVDILAPGSDVVSASHLDDVGSHTQSGTSMACPHVAGAAALVLTEKGVAASIPRGSNRTQDAVLSNLLKHSTRDKVVNMRKTTVNKLLNVAPFIKPMDNSGKRNMLWWILLAVFLGGGCCFSMCCLMFFKHKHKPHSKSEKGPGSKSEHEHHHHHHHKDKQGQGSKHGDEDGKDKVSKTDDQKEPLKGTPSKKEGEAAGPGRQAA